MTHTTENLWKILREKHSLKDIIELSDSQGMFDITQDHIIQNAFSIISAIKTWAYQLLVMRKEIDGTKYFHVSTGDYLGEIYRDKDIAYKDGNVYRLQRKESDEDEVKAELMYKI